ILRWRPGFRLQANEDLRGGPDAANLPDLRFDFRRVGAVLAEYLGNQLDVQAVDVPLEEPDAARPGIAEDDGQYQRAQPDDDAEPPGPPQPQHPGEQSGQAPEKVIVLARMDAGRKQAKREIRIGHVHSLIGRERFAEFLCLFPAALENQRNGVERNFLARTEGLRGDKQEENHRHPPNQRGRRARAGQARLPPGADVWALEKTTETFG